MRDPGNEVVTFVFLSLDFNTKYFFMEGLPFVTVKYLILPLNVIFFEVSHS